MKQLTLKSYVERHFEAEEKERASKILSALEGMSIFEAQEFLDSCKSALMCVEVKVD